MYKSQTDLFKKLIKDIDYDEKTKNLKNAH